MAINPAINGTGNLTNMQILSAMAGITQAGQEAEAIANGARLPVAGAAPVGTTAAPTMATAAPAGEAEGGKKGKGKGKGRPDHAGGPKNAKALPPGLQGKDLPAGNPWRAVAERLEKEKAQQGNTGTGQQPGVQQQPPQSPAELLARLQQLVNAQNPQGAAPAPQAIGAMLTALG